MNHSRRNFLKNSTLALMGTVAFSQELFAKNRKNEIMGIQLYSVREDMGKNPLQTLKAIAEMGYKNIEHAHYVDRKFYGYSALEFKKILDDLGLKMPSGHTVMDKNKHWDAAKNDFTDAWKYTVEDAATCGQLYVISPWLDNSLRGSMSDMKGMMDIFNKSGELCQKSGMKFGYHNHDFEFSQKVDGIKIYDIILQNTDPKLVTQQLDIGNMYGGGGRAIEILKQYPGRFLSMHVKDEIKSEVKNEKWESCVLGKGVVGTKEVLDLGRKIGGTTEFIIEQESYQGISPLESAKQDLAIMKKWGY